MISYELWFISGQEDIVIIQNVAEIKFDCSTVHFRLLTESGIPDSHWFTFELGSGVALEIFVNKE